jgi:superfamily II DNA/RNA helicase
MGQEAADDNQPRDENGEPVRDPAKRVKGRPVIIFTKSLDAVDNLAASLKGRGYRVVGISGRDSGANKLAKKELFQPSGDGKPQADVLVMSDAMSAGIDLPRAEAVIHYDMPDTSKTLEQRSARAIRLSSKHPVDVYNVVTNTPYEARRVDRVKTKGVVGDVLQHPAEVLDDTSMMKNIADARVTAARKHFEGGAGEGNSGA